MAQQLCEYTKKQGIIYIEQMNYMLCDLYHNKVRVRCVSPGSNMDTTLPGRVCWLSGLSVGQWVPVLGSRLPSKELVIAVNCPSDLFSASLVAFRTTHTKGLISCFWTAVGCKSLFANGLAWDGSVGPQACWPLVTVGNLFSSWMLHKCWLPALPVNTTTVGTL